MKILCKNKNWEINKDYNIDKILYLLIDRPTYINSLNDYFWYHNNDENEFHRGYDLPAFICNIGYIKWCKNGQNHRNDNKPAVIFRDGKKHFYVNGKYVKK